MQGDDPTADSGNRNSRTSGHVIYGLNSTLNPGGQATRSPELAVPRHKEPPVDRGGGEGDNGQKWEVLKIVGEKVINGVLHYLVCWAPTFQPAFDFDCEDAILDWNAEKAQSQES
jgi:hypothetical protein